MQTKQRLFDDRNDLFDSGRWRRTDTDRGAGTIKCGICAGPLADHEIGDHRTRVVERMLRIGFPTPVGSRFP